MTEPTGNVWTDPDTGKPANPDNIQTDMDGSIPMDQKYGPGILDDTGDPAPEIEGGATVVDLDGPGDDLPDVGELTPAKNPNKEPADVDEDDEELKELISVMRQLNTQKKESSATIVTQATKALEQMMMVESKRAGGPRKAITKRLNAYGIRNPTG